MGVLNLSTNFCWSHFFENVVFRPHLKAFHHFPIPSTALCHFWFNECLCLILVFAFLVHIVWFIYVVLPISSGPDWLPYRNILRLWIFEQFTNCQFILAQYKKHCFKLNKFSGRFTFVICDSAFEFPKDKFQQFPGRGVFTFNTPTEVNEFGRHIWTRLNLENVLKRGWIWNTF